MARVLNIEHDPRNRLLVRKLLSAEGHEVVDSAEKLTRIVARVVADIRRGKDREAALKAHDRYGHIRKVVPG